MDSWNFSYKEGQKSMNKIIEAFFCKREYIVNRCVNSNY